MKKKFISLSLCLSIIIFQAQASDDFDEFSDEFSKNTKEERFDPLVGYNEVMTNFNDKMYIYLLNPVATGYANVVPETGRSGIANFFHNLLFPIRFVNNILQLKFSNAGEELGRFVVNTIWGVGGFMDPAKTELNWLPHEEDFGQTLGFYGIGEGFPIVLPFLGPSNLRDTVGLAGDMYLNPLNNMAKNDVKYKIPDNDEKSLAITGFNTVNQTSLRLGQYETIRKDAIDLYPYLRDIYSQAREKQIKE